MENYDISLFREEDLTAEIVSIKKHLKILQSDAGVLKKVTSKLFANGFVKRPFFDANTIHVAKTSLANSHFPAPHPTTPPFLFRQVLAEADFLSKFTANITWRGGQPCEGVQVATFQTIWRLEGKFLGAI